MRDACLRFAPRIRDVLDQRLFTIGPPEAEYGPFTALLRGRINTRLVRDTWDDVLRWPRRFATARSRRRS